MSGQENLVLFDGVCNLCNGAVLFIIKRDKKKKFLFASLQSPIAKQKLADRNSSSNLETIVLLSGNSCYQRSDAALEIARQLSGLWPALYVFKIVPRFIRDAVYDWIAHNRYRFFGKKDACMIPTPDLKSRFID